MSIISAHRLAEAAPAGQLVGAQRVEAAVVGGEQQLVGGLRVEGEGRAVAFLELERSADAERRHGPCIARIQPRCDRITVIGSLLDHRLQRNSRAGAASSIVVRRAPSAVSSA